MKAEQTKLTKAQVNALLKELAFDPKDTTTRLNVAARTDRDYCISRATEELVSSPKRANVLFAIQLLLVGELLDA